MKERLRMKTKNLMQNDGGGVSIIVASMILVAIVTTSMSVLITITNENTQNAIMKENEIYQEHYDLVQEMQEFLGTIKGFETGDPYNETLDVDWVWPANRSTDVERAPELRVYVDGPGGSLATVTIRRYGTDSAYSVEMAPLKTETVTTGSLVTYKYAAASSYDETYYWKVEIQSPGKKELVEYYLNFETMEDPNPPTPQS